MLTLMYITNNSEVAQIAQKAGVDRIWVDMECIGKEDRQGGMDTVKNHHTIKDVKILRKVVTTSKLMVRINPIHEKTNEWLGMHGHDNLFNSQEFCCRNSKISA